MYLFVSQFLEKDSALEPKCLVLGFVFEKKVGRPFEEKKLGGHLKKTRCHLKKQGDSAVVDGGRYFVGADHQSGRTAQENNFGMTIQRTVKHSSEENSEQFRGKF